jgi:hypothetical protein
LHPWSLVSATAQTLGGGGPSLGRAQARRGEARGGTTAGAASLAALSGVDDEEEGVGVGEGEGRLRLEWKVAVPEAVASLVDVGRGRGWALFWLCVHVLMMVWLVVVRRSSNQTDGGTHAHPSIHAYTHPPISTHPPASQHGAAVPDMRHVEDAPSHQRQHHAGARVPESAGLLLFGGE